MSIMPTVRSPVDLESFIRTCPVIDNHAHNIYKIDGLKKENLLTITTEASEEALDDTPSSLSHIRAAKQLRRLYGLPAEAKWTNILKKRSDLLDQDPDALTRECLQEIQTILIDDGFDDPDVLEPFHWHNRFTRSPCKRLIRIEELAADILSSLHDQEQLPTGPRIADEAACNLAWTTFLTAYEVAIATAISSPEVAGFKSARCFTLGLAVTAGSDDEVADRGLQSFRYEFLPACVSNDFRIGSAAALNDALIISLCKLIAAAAAADRHHRSPKPLQFHTGVGNKEIPVLESNPACLQPLIAAFPTVPIVLLHASYPYTTTAGHLATVFSNVYLDIGAVFPEISRNGQERVVRECLELTPWRKVLWSTDGHWFPETFWLANLQGREAIGKVLRENVECGDLTVEEAFGAAKGILFENANRIYGLGLVFDDDDDAVAG